MPIVAGRNAAVSADDGPVAADSAAEATSAEVKVKAAEASPSRGGGVTDIQMGLPRRPAKCIGALGALPTTVHKKIHVLGR